MYLFYFSLDLIYTQSVDFYLFCVFVCLCIMTSEWIVCDNNSTYCIKDCVFFH